VSGLDPQLRALAVAGAEDAAAEARLDFLTAVLGPAPAADAAGCELALLVMRGFGRISADQVRAQLTALQVEAAGRLRARAPVLRGMRRGSGDVEVEPPLRAHAGFFGLDVYHLRHRRFDGGLSPVLRREVFVTGDAVTVLPYDARRDRVLLVEQIRMGPLGRGDPLPWQLEAIAGRIDPGETPEVAARREAVEEAGLVLGKLEKVAEYYPTPGAVTEYLYSYVALCDLPDGVAGVFGAAEEAEDIRGHLVAFDRLVEAMARGEIGNAPLLLTVLWLQRERSRLRG